MVNTNALLSRDVLIQSPVIGDATHFYKDVLGLPASYQGKSLVGFEAGSFLHSRRKESVVWAAIRISRF